MKVITVTSTGKKETVKPGFAVRVQQESGKELRQCYHCLKCSAGCPLTFAMDWTPNQVIRMVQLGLEKRVLSSSTIWLCASCETCSTRCPNEIDLPAIMDTLKEMAIRNDVRSEQAVIQVFHRVFLNCLREYGRLHELSLLLSLKLLTLNLFEDMGLGMKMFAKGKINIFPTRIKNTHQIEAIFRTFGESKRSRI